MPNARHDLGRVASVKAEAIGEPGQRTFRLLLDGPRGGACLWLEKEQLSQLSMAVRQILSLSASEESPVYPSPPPAEQSTGTREPMEFTVGKLSLGHEPRQDLFLIEAHDREEDQDGDPLLEFWASRSQMTDLAEEAQTVVAAGRPLCPLCNAPMGAEAHVCPRSNGHHSAGLD